MSLLDRRIRQSWQSFEEGRLSLLTITSRLGPEQEKQQPSEGEWCVLEVIQHLYLVDRSILKVILKTEPDRSPGFADWVKYPLLLLAMEVPFKFKAPKVTRPREIPEHARELVQAWAETRVQWHEYLTSAPEAAYSNCVFSHPRAGKMTLDQTLTWLTRHQQRHLRQARRIVKKISPDS